MAELQKQLPEKFVIGEFWTNKQRQGHPLHHTISYRASFKPELPAFFFKEYLNKKKCVVYDPFGGRGTTAIQANLDGHYAIHNDIHPLSIFLAKSRQIVPPLEKLEEKLQSLSLERQYVPEEGDDKLLPFFHPDTLQEIKCFRRQLKEDPSPAMQFLGLIALSRLHGHSSGFFSVYTFPQVSIPPKAQAKNNQKRNQIPEYRAVLPRILKKLKQDLKEKIPPFYHEFSKKNIYSLSSANLIQSILPESVDLIVTSPPFLDKVDYEGDNWLRNWFLDIPTSIDRKPSIYRNLSEWQDFLGEVLQTSSVLMKPKSRLVMEVGEVVNAGETVHLDEWLVDLAEQAGLIWEKTFIQTQNFTKLSHCWKVSNNEKGTNTHRCVVFRKAKVV